MNYWPGTNIPKSNGNAFTSWKTAEQISKESKTKQMRLSGVMTKPEDLSRKKSFTIYSKARTSQ